MVVSLQPQPGIVLLSAPCNAWFLKLTRPSSVLGAHCTHAAAHMYQHTGPSLRRCRWPAGRAPQMPLSRGPYCRFLAGLLCSYLQTWGQVLGLNTCRWRAEKDPGKGLAAPVWQLFISVSGSGKMKWLGGSQRIMEDNCHCWHCATRYGTSQLAKAGQRLFQEPGLGGRGGGSAHL